jgi:hypothetical protein
MEIVKLNNLMASNKSERQALALSIISEVQDGELDPMQAFIFASKGEELFKSLVDNLRPIVASKGIQKGGITLYEANITERKNPDKYDFNACGDSEWLRLTNILAETKELLKQRETFLKSLTEPVSTLDGEIINKPEVLHGAQNIAVKFL